MLQKPFHILSVAILLHFQSATVVQCCQRWQSFCQPKIWIFVFKIGSCNWVINWLKFITNIKCDSIATHIKEFRQNISISERNYVRIRQSQGSETKIAMTNRFQMGIQLQTTRTSFSLDGILLFTFGHAIDVGPPLLQKWTIITQFDKLNSSKLTAEYDSVANYS